MLPRDLHRLNENEFWKKIFFKWNRVWKENSDFWNEKEWKCELTYLTINYDSLENKMCKIIKKMTKHITDTLKTL